MATKKISEKICQSCFGELSESDVVDVLDNGDVLITVTGSTNEYLVHIYNISPVEQCNYDH